MDVSFEFKSDKRIDFFIPNEIFEDFKRIQYRASTHYAFAVAYYAVISFLYYRCSYGKGIITQSDLKALLGLNKDNKRIDYLIKKNGLIEKIGYISNTTNYPVKKELNEFNGTYEFVYVDEFKGDFKIEGVPNKHEVKYPVKAFERNNAEGTFFDVRNTIKLDMRKFYEIINDEELGITGFLIYLRLKLYPVLMMGQENIGNELLLSRTTVKEKLKVLENKGLVMIEHEKYDYKGEKLHANTYIAR